MKCIYKVGEHATCKSHFVFCMARKKLFKESYFLSNSSNWCIWFQCIFYGIVRLTEFVNIYIPCVMKTRDFENLVCIITNY